MEDGCLGYSGASTVTSRPLNSITLPWLAFPATQPWAPTQSSRHPSHWANSKDGAGGKGGRKMSTNRLGNSSILRHNTLAKTFQGLPRWNNTKVKYTEPAIPHEYRWSEVSATLLLLTFWNCIEQHENMHQILQNFNFTLYLKKWEVEGWSATSQCTEA